MFKFARIQNGDRRCEMAYLCSMNEWLYTILTHVPASDILFLISLIDYTTDSLLRGFSEAGRTRSFIIDQLKQNEKYLFIRHISMIVSETQTVTDRQTPQLSSVNRPAMRAKTRDKLSS